MSFAAALNGLLAVLAGAFGAHALKRHLSPEHLATWETAARYQMYHAFAIYAGAPRSKVAAWFFVAGIVLFSGSLYLLAVTGRRWLGAITPIGGACFVAGWAILVVCSLLKTKT